MDPRRRGATRAAQHAPLCGHQPLVSKRDTALPSRCTTGVVQSAPKPGVGQKSSFYKRRDYTGRRPDNGEEGKVPTRIRYTRNRGLELVTTVIDEYDVQRSKDYLVAWGISEDTAERLSEQFTPLEIAYVTKTSRP